MEAFIQELFWKTVILKSAEKVFHKYPQKIECFVKMHDVGS